MGMAFEVPFLNPPSTPLRATGSAAPTKEELIDTYTDLCIAWPRGFSKASTHISHHAWCSAKTVSGFFRLRTMKSGCAVRPV